MQTPGDCGYFKWLDEQPSEWFRELLVDLRDAVWRLKEELNPELVDDGCDTEIVHQDAQRKQNLQEALLKKDVELEAKEKELLARVEELQSKDKEVEALKAMLKKNNGWQTTLVYLFVFVLGIFVGLVCKTQVE